MSDIKTAQDVVNAARKGMSLRAIAARAGMTKQDLEVRLESNRDFKLAYLNAVADYEEEKRERRTFAAQKAEAEGNWSLVYKEAHEAIKELNERDATIKVHIVSAPDAGLLEPDYQEHSEEELAAIRAKTESEADGSDE
jgi:hypothetical protein